MINERFTGHEFSVERAALEDGGFVFTPQSSHDNAHLERMVPRGLEATYKTKWDGLKLVFKRVQTRPEDWKSQVAEPEPESVPTPAESAPFAGLSLADLRTLAVERGVNHDSKTSREVIIARLTRAGVTPPQPSTSAAK